MNGNRELQNSLPAVHALHLAELVARWQVSPEALFAGLDLCPEDLADPHARLSLQVVEQLVEQARRLTGEPALGLFVGMQMRVSTHGYLGFAAMTAATVREAIEMGIRFAPTRTGALALALEVEGDRASLIIEERADFGSARDVVVLSLLVGLWQIGQALTGQDLAGGAEVAFAAPPYSERFRQLWPEVRFGRPRHRLIFAARLLDLPLVLADPAALRLAREHCERQLDGLGADGQGRAASPGDAAAAEPDLVARVRAELDPVDPQADGKTATHASGAQGFRSLEQVAARLHLSPRTLKRRLAAAATSYSRLLEEHRRQRALELMQRPSLSLEEVAARLGYSDLANFTRAFRRWTGRPPGLYRRAVAAVPEEP